MQSRCFEDYPEGAQQILLVAEKLFGDHGLTGVSLRQITTAAGQANNSIIHHYFGSRAGLVQAVYEMRLPALDRDRTKLLDAFSSAGDPTVDQLFGALRSEERRVGKGCVSTCRSRWWPYHKKNKKQ